MPSGVQPEIFPYHLFHLRWHEGLHGEANAPLTALIWSGAMNDFGMVERHLTWFQYHVDGFSLVDLYDLLAASEYVVFAIGILMFQDFTAV